MTTNRKHTVGKHAIIELSDCSNCADYDAIKGILFEAARVANATILDYRMHSFGNPQGYTGVFILAESHITFHTWEEYAYIAIDIFMCGNTDIDSAIDVIVNGIECNTTEVINIDRGYTHENQ